MNDNPDLIIAVAKELVPTVYADLLQPAARATGTTLGNVIHAALSPINLAAWTVDQTMSWLEHRLEELLHDTPPGRIQPPAPVIAVPAILALQLAGSDSDLRELFANLVATAVDRDTATDAHPAFVEIIKQLAPEEARFLHWFGLSRSVRLFHRSGTGRPVAELIQKGDRSERDKIAGALIELGQQAVLTLPELAPLYVSNLTRLGIMVISDVLGEQQTVDRVVHLELTAFGELFTRACVISRQGGVTV